MPRPATGGAEFGEHAISKPRRPRWTPSEDAKALLEKVFIADSFPTFAVRSQLAEQLSIDSRQVQIWFQNRRQRERLKTGSHATALPEADDEVDDSPTGAAWQEVVPPRVALLGSLDDGVVPPPHLGPSDTPTTWDAQDAGADVTTLADRRLTGGSPDCTVQAPACPAPVARDPGSPRSAGSDETAQTSLAHPAALSLQASPLLTSSPALDTLVSAGGAAAGSGSTSCSAVLPDAAQAARTLQLPGGGTVDLPSGAPPALRQMFDTPGGSRALQLAARSLLKNNPILQHPGAPCHALLTGLANMQQPPRSGAGSPAAASDGSAEGGAPRPSFRRSDASSEALEVLSSQFFSPAPPSSSRPS